MTINPELLGINQEILKLPSPGGYFPKTLIISPQDVAKYN